MTDGGSRWRHAAIGRWEEAGAYHDVGGHRLFAADLGPLGEERAEPLLVLHGFPTSSFDFAEVAPQLARRRRVVLPDLLGYGLSDKPDVSYTMVGQAELVMGLCARLGLERMALLSHDMGDTVGGELLARQMEGSWPVEVTRRVVTNGSIYIVMAHLTAGQQMLLALPDEPIAADAAPPADALCAALQATLHPRHRQLDMGAHAELMVHGGGNRMMARTIRYIEERRANERRFTGAIESHPSPLSVVWGTEDPIAVSAMAERLLIVRPDTTVQWMTETGHYPQVEAPDEFAAAVESGLEGRRRRR